MLHSSGSATYIGKTAPSFADFLVYYGWLFLDLLPALNISQTLGLAAPIEPNGIVAGLPIVAFKGFVILVLLRVIKDWWAGMNRQQRRSGEKDENA